MAERGAAVLHGWGAGGLTTLQAAQRTDFRTYLPDDILVKVDRASMLCSLEVRAPWLDRRVVEFAFGRVPDALKAVAAERKILPRRLAARLLPADVDMERKQGFTIPLDSWYRGKWGETLQEILMDARPGLFDRRAVGSIVASARRGRPVANALFALAVAELWRREYHVSAG